MHRSTLVRNLALVALAIATSARAQEAPVPSGEWRGQVQWYATIDAKPDTSAHSVGMLILAVDPRGKVTVGGSDMGCIGLGLFSAGPLATIKNVDITFKSCTYDGYNRRFGGTMLFEDGGRRVKLQLQASNIRIGSKVAFYELKGTLSR